MIRLATLNDLSQINDIYNYAIDTRMATADLEYLTISERVKWFENHNNNKYPIFVYEKNNHVAAWLSVSPYRENRKALINVVEISYYVHKNFFRQGIAQELIKFIIDNSERYGIKIIICILLEINTPSIKLLEKLGFEKWANLPNIVNLENLVCSHLYYGLVISKYHNNF